MLKKLLLSLFATAAVVATFVAITPEANACAAPIPEFAFEVLEEDTPDCIELDGGGPTSDEDGETVMSMGVRNKCDHPLELEAIECAGCEEEVVIEPPEQPESNDDDQASDDESSEADEGPRHPAYETKFFVVENGGEDGIEEGKTYQQYYEWRLDDQHGEMVTETRYDGEESPCTFCSTAGDSLPTDLMMVFAVVLTVLGVRRFANDEDGTGATAVRSR